MRYYFMLDLKDDPELIEDYEFWHRPENIWKEIPEGIRKIGISEMEIFRWNDRLVMMIGAGDDFDLEKNMQLLSQLPRQQEWEEFMNQFQRTLKGAPSGEKWQLMKNIFSLSECK